MVAPNPPEELPSSSPSQPKLVMPVIDYPTQAAGNHDGSKALVFGLLGFVPFVTGILAIKHGRRGLARVAAEPRAGGAGKSRAGVVLGVTSVMAWSIAIVLLPPAVLRAREQARLVQCASQLRQIGTAVQMYAATNRGFLPATLDDVISPTMITPQVLQCPAAKGDPKKPPASTGKFGNYGYVYLGAGQRIQSLGPASTTPLAFEPPTNHAADGGLINVLFVDGHVEALKGPAAQAILALTPPTIGTPSATTSQPSFSPAPTNASE